ncbi:MAG: hypothetical protein QCH99_09230 [Candidatus Bathyarchaeota archaeon]|nr:hypothetical protein [Candidatus Bathyarchaeum tardum]WGM90049.1 MAG: hypothetical protein NUK63_02715 [Candidatus Bathyarchaeum tardum]
MPSIIPSYVYTFFALTIMGTLLICAFASFSVSVKQDVEIEQLKNLLQHVAAESCELISTTTSNNSTATLRLSMPSNLCEKSYWLQFRNDSSHAWVEGGLASTPVETSLKIYVPGTVTASGLYKSGYGFAELRCELQEGTVFLNLSEAS